MYTGGCFCGAVQYEADAPVLNCTWCHCSMCRRLSGAPSVAWFSVPRAQFRYVRGKPAIFHSSPGVTREFCGVCGTHLTFADDSTPGDLDITTARPHLCRQPAALGTHLRRPSALPPHPSRRRPRKSLNHSSAERFGPPRKQMRQPLKTRLQAPTVLDVTQRDPNRIDGSSASCECLRRRDCDALAAGCTRKP